MLDYSDLLIVPGGWASDKTAALGQEGRDAVREFVRSGGSYLGICGGAGFALDTQDGLGLVNVKRVPTAQRIPSFSGEIGLIPEAAPPVLAGDKVSAPVPCLVARAVRRYQETTSG